MGKITKFRKAIIRIIKRNFTKGTKYKSSDYLKQQSTQENNVAVQDYDENIYTNIDTGNTTQHGIVTDLPSVKQKFLQNDNQFKSNNNVVSNYGYDDFENYSEKKEELNQETNQNSNKINQDLFAAELEAEHIYETPEQNNNTPEQNNNVNRKEDLAATKSKNLNPPRGAEPIYDTLEQNNNAAQSPIVEALIAALNKREVSKNDAQFNSNNNLIQDLAPLREAEHIYDTLEQNNNTPEQNNKTTLDNSTKKIPHIQNTKDADKSFVKTMTKKINIVRRSDDYDSEVDDNWADVKLKQGLNQNNNIDDLQKDIQQKTNQEYNSNKIEPKEILRQTNNYNAPDNKVTNNTQSLFKKNSDENSPLTNTSKKTPPAVMPKNTSPAVMLKKTSPAVMPKEILRQTNNYNAPDNKVTNNTQSLFKKNSDENSPLTNTSKKTSPPVMPKNTSPPVMPKNTSPPVMPKNTSPPVMPKNTSPPVTPKNTSPPVMPKRLGQTNNYNAPDNKVTNNTQSLFKTNSDENSPLTNTSKKTSPPVMPKNTSPPVMPKNTSPPVMPKEILRQTNNYNAPDNKVTNNTQSLFKKNSDENSPLTNTSKKIPPPVMPKPISTKIVSATITELQNTKKIDIKNK